MVLIPGTVMCTQDERPPEKLLVEYDDVQDTSDEEVRAHAGFHGVCKFMLGMCAPLSPRSAIRYTFCPMCACA
jgi:hypothetical protein